MSKSSDNRVKVENWNVADPAKRFSDGRVVVTKVAVRDSRGRFHGATNFKGSVLGK
jgi:hypothetical protein